MARRKVPAKSPDIVAEFLEYAADVRSIPFAQRLDLATLGQRMLVEFNPSTGFSNVGMREDVSLSGLEQAALRIRPALAQSESIYVPKVLAELGRRHDNAEIRAKLGVVRGHWANFDKRFYWEAGASQTKSGLAKSVWRNDREIAWDYLNGRLFHRDREKAERVRYFSDATLQHALVLWVKDAVVLCEATRNFILDEF